MHSLPILNELPAGYFVEESPKGVLAMHVDVARAMHEAGFGPESDGPRRPSALTGRRPLFEMEVGGERFVVRRFSHGGALRLFTRSRFADPTRPFRELILSHALIRNGLRTPQVVAARADVAPVGGWHLEVITRRVDHTLDLDAALEEIRSGRVSQPARSRLFHTAGDVLRKLHAVGFLHGDMQPGNLLVRREALDAAVPEPWVLDLEGSAFVETLGDSERRRNLGRLYRAVRNRELRGRPFVTRSDIARFMRGYDPDGVRWKNDWRAVQGRHGRLRPLHAISRFLDRLYGRHKGKQLPAGS